MSQYVTHKSTPGFVTKGEYRRGAAARRNQVQRDASSTLDTLARQMGITVAAPKLTIVGR